jgi:hypothetical protein
LNGDEVAVTAGGAVAVAVASTAATATATRPTIVFEKSMITIYLLLGQMKLAKGKKDERKRADGMR